MLHISRNSWYTSPLLKRLPPLHISEHITKTDIKNSATEEWNYLCTADSMTEWKWIMFPSSLPGLCRPNTICPSVNSDKCVQNQGYIGNFSHNSEWKRPHSGILELCTYTISVWERIILQNQSPHSALNCELLRVFHGVKVY